MALIKCKECGHEVSSKAATCPNCGAPMKKQKKSSSGWLWIILILLLVFGSSISTFLGHDDSPTKAKQTAPKLSDAECMKSLSCWAERNMINAIMECKGPIEKLAKYDVEWTDGMMTPTFSKLAWADQKKGVITYIGDKVKFQNGFGAWQQHTYTCNFDPISNAVSVKVAPGSL